MKYFIFLALLVTLSFANIENINSFEADFEQKITNEKGNILKYTGHITAMKPQFALWNYKTPVKKEIYVRSLEVVIIEPEIEQVIIKTIKGDFDFFSMIQRAKKISENSYSAKFNGIVFTIVLKNSLIESITYMDEFENDVIIHFSKQKQNTAINTAVFQPSIPQEYDVIRD